MATSDPKPIAGSGEIRTQAQAVGLAAGWLLNENAGATVYDVGPNGNNGTFGSGVSWQSGGRVGPSVDFPGTVAGHVTIANAASLNVATDFSVEVWFKALAAPSADETLVSKVGTANQGGYGVFLMHQGGGGVAQFTTFKSGVNDDYLGTVNIGDGNWHQVVCVYDGAKKYIYVDGALDASKAYAGNVDVNTDPLYIGGNVWTSLPLPWTNLIDQVRIYGRALAAADVLDRYRNPFADIWNITDGHPYTAQSYFPLYWRDGYWPPAALAFAPPASASREVDIRLYNADGTRKFLPQQWIGSASFELAERGGMQNGSMEVLVPWEQLPLVGTEYVDVWLWGQRLYRGWVRTAQQELGVPEKATPTLYGLMELLNGYLVRRCYCYGAPVDISQVFLDLANEYVVKANRLPNLVLDATGVPALGIEIQSFCAKGKSIPQALNDLCDQAPDQLIWGGDVDAMGRDRLYLRPRATATNYKFAVGDKITALIYPRDATQVVNRVYVTGGKADPPNLAPNGSFEECSIPGEYTSNILQNPSFESSTDVNTFPPWVRIGQPTIASGQGHTGSASLDMDDNPTAPEGVYQTIGVTEVQPLSASCWLQSFFNENYAVQILLQYYLSGVLVAEQDSPVFPAGGNGAWGHNSFSAAFAGQTGQAADTLKVTYLLVTASGSHGMNIDDCSVWGAGQNIAASWNIGSSHLAAFTTLDWANHDITAYDGSVVVKAQAAILSGGGYGEIRTTVDSRVQVKFSNGYLMQCAFWCETPSQVAIGIQEWQDSTAKTLTVGTPVTIASGQWVVLTLYIVTGNTTNGADLLIRFYDGNVVYVDGVGLFEGASNPPDYYPGDTFTAVRDVSDYTSGQIGTDAAASITTWGEREKEESVDTVIDRTTLDAYCIGYLKAKATPAVQGRLTIKGAVAPIGLDGQVQIENLPSAPPALFPSRLRYQIGETIDLDVDLNNERPDLALLLRNAVIGVSQKA